MDGEDTSRIIASVSENLGMVFRHLLPGVFIMSAAYVAHPSWFQLDTNSWQHLTLYAVMALTAGNVWFTVNRYGVHQLIDYVAYLLKSRGPAAGSWLERKYWDTTAKHAAKSLRDSRITKRERQHVAFRASSVLLLYTIAEIGWLFWWKHDANTFFDKHPRIVFWGSLTIFVIAIWQNLLARRIDFEIVECDARA
jgi:hypothetical protein